MHIAVVIDDSRLLETRTTWVRLHDLLAERSVKLTLIGSARPDRGPPLAESAWRETELKPPPWLRRTRTQRLATAMEADPPKAVHAMGDLAWSTGLDLAGALEVPATLEIFSGDQIRRVPPRTNVPIAGYLAATASIAADLKGRVEPELVSVVRVGTEIPAHPPERMADPDLSIGLAIIGSGRDVNAYQVMLEGLSRITTQFPQMQACMELRGPRDHEIWRIARRLDLLGRLSTVENASVHRNLVSGCDILVVPERYGEARSLIYEAMAHGMALVVAEDPAVDVLVDDHTALVVRDMVAEGWSVQLRRVLRDTELVRRLGTEARKAVQAGHTLEHQASDLHQALDQVVSGGAHTFVSAAGRR